MFLKLSCVTSGLHWELKSLPNQPHLNLFLQRKDLLASFQLQVPVIELQSYTHLTSQLLFHFVDILVDT